MDSASVVPARGARADDLLELLGLTRRELIRRGELVPPNWVDEGVDDLRSGRLTGWYLPPTRALAFYSRRAHRAYGHVHVTGGPERLDRAVEMLTLLADGLPREILRLDAGVTGLDEPEEEEFGRRMLRRPGSELVRRFAMTLDVPRAPAPSTVDLAAKGLRPTTVAAVPIEVLQQLDARGFRGSVDESLLADTPGENARLLSDLIGGTYGRFLSEASRVLLDRDGAPIAAILCAEQSSRTAVVLDAVVDPPYRRQGLGLYLFSWCIQALRALGYGTVQLWVTEANTPARALYDRLGFHPWARSIIYRWRRANVPEDAAPHPQNAR
ncbi:MAG: GNAT family N-acetyltransferase [Thermoplasmata archaeon]|nr:GNAT family N-acetyltransferase [Thermoplasmata archaeon]